MAKNSETVTGTIDAPADVVYGVIADYENHHPHILPDLYFKGLEVVEGGVGAGTRINVFIVIKGSDQTMEMIVEEPLPGRVMTETDLKGGMKTTFEVAPMDDGKSAVSITTAWPPARGFQALFNRFFLRGYVQRMLEAELGQLAAYVDAIAATDSLSC
jgi:hypothetical protein